MCLRWAAAIAVVSALHAAPAHSQEPAAVDSATVERIRARAAEFSEPLVHLDSLLDRVFDENPELWDRVETLEAAYVEAMVGLDAETTARRARLQDLEAEYNRLVLADDTAGVRALTEQGAAIRKALQATAAEATRLPGIASEVEAFRIEVAARLSQLDPGAVRLLERSDVLGGMILASVLGIP